jgi:hypothetical protein
VTGCSAFDVAALDETVDDADGCGVRAADGLPQLLDGAAGLLRDDAQSGRCFADEVGSLLGAGAEAVGEGERERS